MRVCTGFHHLCKSRPISNIVPIENALYKMFHSKNIKKVLLVKKSRCPLARTTSLLCLRNSLNAKLTLSSSLFAKEDDVGIFVNDGFVSGAFIIARFLCFSASSASFFFVALLMATTIPIIAPTTANTMRMIPIFSAINSNTVPIIPSTRINGNNATKQPLSLLLLLFRLKFLPPQISAHSKQSLVFSNLHNVSNITMEDFADTHKNFEGDWLVFAHFGKRVRAHFCSLS